MHTFTSWQQAGKYYNYNGNKVFYIDEGTGEPIVFLHGYPTASYDWKYIWDDLKATNKLIALDLIGFGFSDKPRNLNYSIHLQADIVVDLLNSLGVEGFYLVAHDYSVSVAQELMARQKNGELQNLKLRKVCLLNGGLFPPLHRPLLIQKMLVSPLGAFVGKLINKKRFEKSFAKIFAPDKKPTAQEIDEFWTLIEYNGGRAIVHKLLHYLSDRRNNLNRWLATLQNPPVPVRLIYGLLDPISGKHLVDWYKENIPNPDVVELPLNGHYPQVENPAEVLRAIKEWVN
jgi:pimeloyl-ACP methyl ester carboxylesterase